MLNTLGACGDTSVNKKISHQSLESIKVAYRYSKCHLKDTNLGLRLTIIHQYRLSLGITFQNIGALLGS